MSADVVALRGLVTTHAVKYEVWPHYEIAGNQKIMAGFDLELCGTHDHGHARLNPGCPACEETYADLKTLAEAILPAENRPADYDILPFDHALHMTPQHPESPEVLLDVCIEHNHHSFSPVDACEETCLKQVIEKLAALGVARGGGVR